MKGVVLLRDRKQSSVVSCGLRLHEHLGHLLRRTDHFDRSSFLNLTRPYDVTPPQYAALLALQELGATSQRHVGQYIAMEASNLHGVLRRLLAKGLICRLPSEHDKRRKLIALTESGHRLLEELRPLAREASRTTLSALTESEQKTFLHLLTKIALPGGRCN